MMHRYQAPRKSWGRQFGARELYVELKFLCVICDKGCKAYTLSL